MKKALVLLLIISLFNLFSCGVNDNRNINLDGETINKIEKSYDNKIVYDFGLIDNYHLVKLDNKEKYKLYVKFSDDFVLEKGEARSIILYDTNNQTYSDLIYFVQRDADNKKEIMLKIQDLLNTYYWNNDLWWKKEHKTNLNWNSDLIYSIGKSTLDEIYSKNVLGNDIENNEEIIKDKIDAALLNEKEQNFGYIADLLLIKFNSDVMIMTVYIEPYVVHINRYEFKYLSENSQIYVFDGSHLYTLSSVCFANLISDDVLRYLCYRQSMVMTYEQLDYSSYIK